MNHHYSIGSPVFSITDEKSATVYDILYSYKLKRFEYKLIFANGEKKRGYKDKDLLPMGFAPDKDPTEEQKHRVIVKTEITADRAICRFYRNDNNQEYLIAEGTGKFAEKTEASIAQAVSFATYKAYQFISGDKNNGKHQDSGSRK